MIGDLAKRGVTEGSAAKVLQPYAYISLNSKPIILEDNPDDLVQTYFKYALRYKPSANSCHKRQPFIVSCELIRAGTSGDSMRVSGYEEFLEKAKTNKGFAWLAKHTNICPELFDIAKKNPGCFFPIAVDIIKYYKDIGDEECLGLFPDDREIERLRSKYHLEQYGITDVEV